MVAISLNNIYLCRDNIRSSHNDYHLAMFRSSGLLEVHSPSS
ncbi:unnamed protein product [Fusarium venenatum]|uniref:Uncharacterized protein n=1 Tax=Fusarium venenatum TaxID=56646 RepID=A0A2L2SNT6_9HYPO|nr:uncharacterized protein FVRRES_11985 [Fusarium venenatum]CEI39294.1 unnamed protein product [Fusarium venenatum]